MDDLFLLEAHQIDGLPDRAPAGALAAVLHSDPRLLRFFVTRHPPIEEYLSGLLVDHGPVAPDELASSPIARRMYAVEPVATLRQYIRANSGRLGIDNLCVLDGLLDAIPLPAGSADVLLTCQAIGWQLDDELREIERVVKPGGTAIHLFGASSVADNTLHEPLVADGYSPEAYEKDSLRILRYRKLIGVSQ